MKVDTKQFSVLLTALFILVAVVAWQASVAEDVVHAVSGIVKSVDKGTKTMVIKTSDGTEQTIKWTDKTTVKGVDASGKAVAAGSVDTYDGMKAGAKISVKYTGKGWREDCRRDQGRQQGHSQSRDTVMP